MSNELTVKGENALGFLLQDGDSLLLKPLQKEIYLDSIYIAGTSHLEDPEPVFSLKEKDEVVLVREPENRYDRRAIRIQTKGGQKLGYVPKKENRIYSRLMDAGKLLKGVVEDNENRMSYSLVSVGIYMVDY